MARSIQVLVTQPIRWNWRYHPLHRHLPRRGAGVCEVIPSRSHQLCPSLGYRRLQIATRRTIFAVAKAPPVTARPWLGRPPQLIEDRQVEKRRKRLLCASAQCERVWPRRGDLKRHGLADRSTDQDKLHPVDARRQSRRDCLDGWNGPRLSSRVSRTPNRGPWSRLRLYNHCP